MAKFKIQQNPTFSIDVAIPLLGKEPVKVPFEFKAFSRKELAEMQDQWIKDTEGLLNENLTNSELIDKQNKIRLEQIKQIVVGWGFDDKFSEKAILELINTIIGSDDAIIRAFFAEIERARLGN